MAAPPSSQDPPVQLLAAHGWCGQADSWQPWINATSPLGWQWICQERGYDGRPPRTAQWQPPADAHRVVIGHSFGPHLVEPAVLAAADAVVLLASFARFLPPGREGRRLQTALAGMAAQLEEPHDNHPDDRADPTGADRAQAMLRQFLVQAALPDPPELMPLGPAATPVPAAGRRRLLRDLRALEASAGLPAGFPAAVPVLIVEAGADQIVGPAARALLREALPQAEVLEMTGAGHAFLRAAVVPAVVTWLQRTLAAMPPRR